MNKPNGGQALLLLILSVGVIITVALSAVSRSVSDIGNTQKDEESLRAFSAAEAGVEQTLKTQVSELPLPSGTPSPTTPPVSIGTSAVGNADTPASYTTSSGFFPIDNTEYTYPLELNNGETATIWLASHQNNILTCAGSGNYCYDSNSDTLRLCWGKPNDNSAVVATFIYDDGLGNLKYVIGAYDPDNTRGTAHNFDVNPVTTNCKIGNTTFGYKTNVKYGTGGSGALGIPSPTAPKLRAVVVRLLYNAQPALVGVSQSGNGKFPVQGRIIESVGQAGDSSRKVQVYALYPEIPDIFQSAIFSPPGITKN